VTPQVNIAGELREFARIFDYIYRRTNDFCAGFSTSLWCRSDDKPDSNSISGCTFADPGYAFARTVGIGLLKARMGAATNGSLSFAEGSVLT
jgi:hypothetical protein